MTSWQQMRLTEAVDAIGEDLRLGLYPWFLAAPKGAGARVRLGDYAIWRRWVEPGSGATDAALFDAYGLTPSVCARLDAEEASPTGIGGVLRQLGEWIEEDRQSRPKAPVIDLATVRPARST